MCIRDALWKMWYAETLNGPAYLCSMPKLSGSRRTLSSLTLDLAFASPRINVPTSFLLRMQSPSLTSHSTHFDNILYFEDAEEERLNVVYTFMLASVFGVKIIQWWVLWFRWPLSRSKRVFQMWVKGRPLWQQFVQHLFLPASLECSYGCFGQSCPGGSSRTNKERFGCNLILADSMRPHSREEKSSLLPWELAWRTFLSYQEFHDILLSLLQEYLRRGFQMEVIVTLSHTDLASRVRK